MKKSEDSNLDIPGGPEMTDADVHEAMKEIQGYLDITAADYREVYRLAFRQATDRINRSITARDIMTAPVVTAKRATPLREVALLMADRGISGLPVLDDNNRVAGVISEKDFLARMGSSGRTTFMAVIADCLKGSGCVALPIRAQKAEDIMSIPPVTISPDATLLEIAALLTERKINRLPVVGDSGELIGIVSREDIIRATQKRKHQPGIK